VITTADKTKLPLKESELLIEKIESRIRFDSGIGGPCPQTSIPEKKKKEA